MIVHQIFGLLGDTEMPELFKKSQIKVKKWCKSNKYTYKLWNEKTCENMMKKYPQYKKMYDNVRYKIMKVDIVRFVILYDRGGIYLDLDIVPKLKSLKNYDLAFAAREDFIEMEVIQSKKKEKVLLEYLDYVKIQIEEKSKKKIYKLWKLRYVYQTTGPLSLTRFLKTHKEIEYGIYTMNAVKYGKMNIKGNEDFLSYPSLSYANKM